MATNFDPNKYSQTGNGKDSVVFSDLTTDLKRHPGTGDITRVTDIESVKNSLRNILKTNHYERIYNPLFGANINAMLFELLDDSTNEVVKSMVISAISNFEPRVKVIDIVVSALVDTNTLTLTIVYAVLNNPDPQILELKVTRIR